MRAFDSSHREHLPGIGAGCRFACMVLAAAFYLLSTGGTLQAQERKPTEYEVKAAYLFNFSKFVRWPANSSVSVRQAFQICILGNDPFGSVLDDTLQGETLEGKKVVSRRITDAQEIEGCQLLFVGTNASGKFAKIRAALGKFAVLTVSDMPMFTGRGGMIGFVTTGGRVRFEVNLGAAEAAGLALSSDLLKVALAVRKAPSPGV